jgi:hypothetical protein
MRLQLKFMNLCCFEMWAYVATISVVILLQRSQNYFRTMQTILKFVILCNARFMEPLYSGKYPAVMVNNVAKRLPKFSRSEYLIVKGSFDFIGLNYYTAYYAANVPCQQRNLSILTDSCTTYTRKLFLTKLILLHFFVLVHLLTCEPFCCISYKKWGSYWS